MSIEMEARRTAAQLVDSLSRGKITNFEFEERWPDSAGRNDTALRAIGSMIWNFYSESEPHTFTGEYAPDDSLQGLLARCAAFLRTSLPYEWEYVNFAPPGALTEFIRDVLRQSASPADASNSNALESEEHRILWPFRRVGDYRAPEPS